MQLKQGDQQLKQAEQVRKNMKDRTDAALEAQKVQIDAKQAGIKLAADKRDKDNKMDMEIFKTLSQNNKGNNKGD